MIYISRAPYYTDIKSAAACGVKYLKYKKLTKDLTKKGSNQWTAECGSVSHTDNEVVIYHQSTPDWPANSPARNNVMCCIRVIRHNGSRLMSFPAHQLVCFGCRNRQRWCLNFMTMTAGYRSRIITLGVNCRSYQVRNRHWPTFLTKLYIIVRMSILKDNSVSFKDSWIKIHKVK